MNKQILHERYMNLRGATVLGVATSPYADPETGEESPCAWLQLCLLDSEEDTVSAVLPLLCPICGRPLHFESEHSVFEFGEKLKNYHIKFISDHYTSADNISNFSQKMGFTIQVDLLEHNDQNRNVYFPCTLLWFSLDSEAESPPESIYSLGDVECGNPYRPVDKDGYVVCEECENFANCQRYYSSSDFHIPESDFAIFVDPTSVVQVEYIEFQVPYPVMVALSDPAGLEEAPPCAVSSPNCYVSYFENERGDQFVFLLDYRIGKAVLRTSMTKWQDMPVKFGEKPPLPLNELEKTWLNLCWKAALRRGTEIHPTIPL